MTKPESTNTAAATAWVAGALAALERSPVVESPKGRVAECRECHGDGCDCCDGLGLVPLGEDDCSSCGRDVESCACEPYWDREEDFRGEALR